MTQLKIRQMSLWKSQRVRFCYSYMQEVALNRLSDFDVFSKNIVINGDNEKVLPLLSGIHKKCDFIYLDPPYNTKAKIFNYKNDYSTDDWELYLKKLMRVLFRDFLSEDGILAVAIDYKKLFFIGSFLTSFFSKDYHIVCVTVYNPGFKRVCGMAIMSEYVVLAIPKKGGDVGRGQLVKDRRQKMVIIRRADDHRPNSFYPVFIKDDRIIGVGDIEPFDLNKRKQEWLDDGVCKIYPIPLLVSDLAEVEGHCYGWRFAHSQFMDRINEVGVVSKGGYYSLYHTQTDSEMYSDLFMDAKYTGGSGTRHAREIGVQFSFCKSVDLLKDLILLGCRGKEDAFILDCYGGSGTTGHAVNALNASDGGGRRFCLIEKEAYARDILLERLRKTMPPKKFEELLFCA